MNSNKHTPAPWKWMYWQNDGQVVYNVKPVMRPGDGQIENEMDALLIAAAPDLLEALERIMIVAENHTSEHTQHYFHREFSDARAAIKKATEKK